MTSNDSMVFCRGCGKEIHKSAPTCPQCGFVQGVQAVAGGGQTAAAQMDFVSAVKSCLSKYATFSGRARRSEYWYFYLFCIIAAIVGSVVDAATHTKLITVAINLGLLLPSLSVSIRRLHDVGRSGWWFLIAFTGIGLFVLLYWYVKKSQPEDNAYGPSAEGCAA